MNINDLDNITGTLSKPSKMPGWSYGIPAKECKVGSKLAKIPGTVCHGCYALKGCYVFPNVQAASHKLQAASLTKINKGLYRIHESKRIR